MSLDDRLGRLDQINEGQSPESPVNISNIKFAASNSFKIISNSFKSAKIYFGGILDGAYMNMKLDGLNSSYTYLLWIPCGFCFGLLNVYIYSINEFGNPLVYDSIDAYDCAFMCGIYWNFQVFLMSFWLTHELLLKRSLKLPYSHGMLLRYSVAYFLSSFVSIFFWIGSYRVFKTLVPFVGLYSAVLGVLAQSLYIGYQTIHECKRHPDLVNLSDSTVRRKIFFGSFILGFTVVVFPVIIYWISLIAIQIIIQSTNNPIYRTLPVIFFIISRFLTAEVIIRLFKNVLGDEANGFTSMLAVSVVSIAHHSFFAVVLEGNDGYNDVIVLSVCNFLIFVYRTLVLTKSINFTPRRFQKVVFTLIGSPFTLDKYFQIKKIRFRYKKVQVQPINPESGAANVLSSQNLNETSFNNQIDDKDENELLENDRKCMALHFLAWEVYRIIVPILYLVSLQIMIVSANLKNFGGIGISVFHFTQDLTHNNGIEHINIKFAIILSVEIFLFGSELFLLRKLKLQFLGMFSLCLREYGICIAFLIGFFADHQICTVLIHCAIDFSVKFAWLKKNADSTYFTNIQSSSEKW